MNKVILVGRLTKDPEIKNTTTGKTVANFTLAVDRRFKNKDGQKEADFVPIIFWEKQAEILGQYLSKGSQVAISGRLQVRNYEAQDGQRRYVTEVIGEEFTFLSSPKRESSFKQSETPQADKNTSVMGLDEDFHLMAEDDEVPF